jgi:hypothetical protein
MVAKAALLDRPRVGRDIPQLFKDRGQAPAGDLNSRKCRELKAKGWEEESKPSTGNNERSRKGSEGSKHNRGVLYL